MQHKNEQTEQNFADSIYSLFKSKRRTAMKFNELSSAYKSKFGRSLNSMELKELPFVQFEQTDGGGVHHSNVYLVVELDDCCVKCKFRFCKLLHSVRPSDRFHLIYPNNNNNSASASSSPSSSSSSTSADEHPLGKLKPPNIRLIQRVKDIFAECTTPSSRQLTLSQMRSVHNQKFPKYRSHTPTALGIAIRFRSSFDITYDEQLRDHIITFKAERSLNEHNDSSSSRDHRNERHSGGAGSSVLHVQSPKPHVSNVIISSKKSSQSPWNRKPIKMASAATASATATSTNAAQFQSPPPPSSSSSSSSAGHAKKQWRNEVTVTATAAPPAAALAIPLQTETPSDDSENKHPPAHDDTCLTPKKNEHENATANTTANDTEHHPHKKRMEVSEVIPEQSNMFYVNITIQADWNDSKLIPDLVRHISQATGKHVCDAYIRNRVRLGFFTAKTEAIARHLITSVREHGLQCEGRTIEAEMVPLPKSTREIQRQQRGHRVRLRNVNCVMDKKKFEQWVHRATKTSAAKRQVYDIEIVFPKSKQSASQCIMLFDKLDDTQYVVDKLHNVPFRGHPLKVRYWHHPHSTTSSTATATSTTTTPATMATTGTTTTAMAAAVHKPIMPIGAAAAKQATASIWKQKARQRKEKLMQRTSTTPTPIPSTSMAMTASSSSGNATGDAPAQPSKPPKKSMPSDDDRVDLAVAADIPAVQASNDDDDDAQVEEEAQAGGVTTHVDAAGNEEEQPVTQTQTVVDNTFEQQPHQHIQPQITQAAQPTITVATPTTTTAIVQQQLTPLHAQAQAQSLLQPQAVQTQPQTNQNTTTQQLQPQQLEQQIPSLNAFLSQQLSAQQLQQLYMQAHAQMSQLPQLGQIHLVPLQHIQQQHQQQASPSNATPTAASLLNAAGMPPPFSTQPLAIPNLAPYSNVYAGVPNINMNNIHMQQPYIQIPPPTTFSNLNLQQFLVNNAAVRPVPVNATAPNATTTTTMNMNGNANKPFFASPQQPANQLRQTPHHQQQQQHQQQSQYQQYHQHNQQHHFQHTKAKKHNPLDKLCKFCLMDTHDPSKCVWFNPNALK